MDSYLNLVCLVTHVAARCCIKADALTIGGHPDAAMREDGELAVLDWDERGGSIVASGEDAAVYLIERVGQVRALGALLLAVELDAPEDCEVLHDLVAGARCLEENTAGGPVDPLLRLGLCARAVALNALGMPGEWQDRVSKARGEGVLRLDSYDQSIYVDVAMVTLSAHDRAAVEPKPAPVHVAQGGLVALQHSLAVLGWEIRDAEIRLQSGEVKLELHRNDGRWIRLHRDTIGRVMIERFHRRRVIVKYRPGRNPTSDGFRDEFMDRQRCADLQQGLVSVALYVTDNVDPSRQAAMPAASLARMLEAAAA